MSKDYKVTDEGIFIPQDGYRYHKRDGNFQEQRDKYKVPFSCYACNKLMYNIDDSYFYRYGVCMDCSINWILDRDLSEELLRNREELLNYVIKKREEKLHNKE